MVGMDYTRQTALHSDRQRSSSSGVVSSPPYSVENPVKENMYQETSPSSLEKSSPATVQERSTRVQGGPLSPVSANHGSESTSFVASLARSPSFTAGDDGPWRSVVPRSQTPEENYLRQSSGSMPVTQTIPFRQRLTTESPSDFPRPQAARLSTGSQRSDSTGFDSLENSENRYRSISQGSATGSATQEIAPSLQYHHQQRSEDRDARAVKSPSPGDAMRSVMSASTAASLGRPTSHQHLAPSSRERHLEPSISRPSSAYSATSDLSVNARGRTISPRLSPNHHGRRISSNSGHSPDSRPISYTDLLNVPYPQPPPAPAALDNALLRNAVGSNASLLSTKQTLEMYRANVKKTNDPTLQYEFAIFMINAAKEAAAGGTGNNVQRQPSPKIGRDLESSYIDNTTLANSQAELLREARQILQRLADRSYPYAQYYLGDGFSSGLFSKGKEDYDRAFPLFVSASKHGHAEAGYRAALCYEFGWGTRKDAQKAVQFYRQSASKNHPGAMARLGKACLVGDLGLGNRYREGLKWLKRAAEAADFQYNSAPYDLGLLHETGYGDDVFQDESYTAQLFTQSADLGHPEASYRLGDAYEHGKLSCPRDPALSVHFYTGAAQRGHPSAMMALCAWYMVGAEPVLEKDENEAYEWAKKAADCGLPKAEYAVGYFTETGIGCRRDPLEANVWYVKAADQGDERAKQRIAAIRAAASGHTIMTSESTASGKISSKDAGGLDATNEEKSKGKTKKWGLF